MQILLTLLQNLKIQWKKLQSTTVILLQNATKVFKKPRKVFHYEM